MSGAEKFVYMMATCFAVFFLSRIAFFLDRIAVIFQQYLNLMRDLG